MSTQGALSQLSYQMGLGETGPKPHHSDNDLQDGEVEQLSILAVQMVELPQIADFFERFIDFLRNQDIEIPNQYERVGLREDSTIVGGGSPALLEICSPNIPAKIIKLVDT